MDVAPATVDTPGKVARANGQNSLADATATGRYRDDAGDGLVPARSCSKPRAAYGLYGTASYGGSSGLSSCDARLGRLGVKPAAASRLPAQVLAGRLQPNAALGRRGTAR